MDLISIIVPVYNSKKNIPKCIESILKQTYQNIELILINDGSTDGSEKVCKKYADKDNRVTIIHQKNQGASMARNNAMDKARGKYIMFVDSDDYINIDAVENLYNKAADVEWVSGSYVFITLLGKSKIRYENKNYNVTNVIKEMLIDNMNLKTPWGKLYRKDIIKNNNIRFDKDIKYGEDTLFNMEYLLHCYNVCTISDIVYNYYYLGLGISSRKHMDTDVCQFKIFLRQVEIIKKYISNKDEQKELIYKYALNRMLYTFEYYLKSFDGETAEKKFEDIIHIYSEYIDISKIDYDLIKNIYNIFDEREIELLKKRNIKETVTSYRKRYRVFYFLKKMKKIMLSIIYR